MKVGFTIIASIRISAQFLPVSTVAAFRPKFRILEAEAAADEDGELGGVQIDPSRTARPWTGRCTSGSRPQGWSTTTES